VIPRILNCYLLHRTCILPCHFDTLSSCSIVRTSSEHCQGIIRTLVDNCMQLDKHVQHSCYKWGVCFLNIAHQNNFHHRATRARELHRSHMGGTHKELDNEWIFRDWTK
jgi:hypothetical protein